MDENCTVDWEDMDFNRCACPRCSAMFTEARAAGLMPRERAKRSASRLDGRWHRRVKAQREREAHFGRLPVRETNPVPEDWMD
jgi:hypothetical protein